MLFGGSYNLVEVESSMMDPAARNTAGMWTFTAGLGLNVDILTVFDVK